jgi:hypothetical protein
MQFLIDGFFLENVSSQGFLGLIGVRIYNFSLVVQKKFFFTIIEGFDTEFFFSPRVSNILRVLLVSNIIFFYLVLKIGGGLFRKSF